MKGTFQCSGCVKVYTRKLLDKYMLWDNHHCNIEAEKDGYPLGSKCLEGEDWTAGCLAHRIEDTNKTSKNNNIDRENWDHRQGT